MKKKMIVSFTVILSLFLLTGCTSKLKNGEEAIITFKDSEGISAEVFYNLLKEKYSEDEIVDLIDETLLNKEYEKTTEEDVYVNEQIETAKAQAGDDFETYLLQYYNIKSESAFKDMLRLNYKRNKWVEDYAKTKVTEDEINNYYEKKIVGDMKLSHILITPQVSSDATDAEKEAADKKALAKTKQVIKELNNGGDFSTLAKKYSEDEASKVKGGTLGYVNYDGYDENFIDGAVNLKKGEYTKSPVKSQFGYHIILKTDQKAKPKLSKKESDIKETIAKEKVNNDSTFYLKALEELRNQYGMKIKDSKLKKAYENKVNALYKNTESNSK